MAVEQPELPQNLMVGLFETVTALERYRVRYALIGGIAVGYRSRPRFTQDLDFLLDVPQLVLPALLEDLVGRGFQFDIETTVQEWTRDHLTSLSFRGVPIDWLKPVIPLYQHIIERARIEAWSDRSVRVASAEGLILTKLLAFRAQDQADIENLLAANRGQLDLDFIRKEWQAIGDAKDPRMERFTEMVGRLSGS
jgi:hypothetical protein